MRSVPGGASGHAWRTDIQGLRGIAVMAVIAHHAGLPVPGGFFGVDVFFVISGYVVAQMLLRERQATGRIAIGRFFWRRVLRLGPGLALMLCATLVASVVIMSPLGPQQQTAATAWSAVLLHANHTLAHSSGGYFDPPAQLNPLLHTWSLSVEEQWYLIIPSLLALAWRSGGPRTATVLLAVLGAATLALVFVPVAESPDEAVRWLLQSYYSPLTRAWQVIAGMLLALWPWHQRPTAPRAAASGIVGAVIGMGAMLLGDEHTGLPGAWSVLPVIAALLLLYAGTNPDQPVTRLLGRAPLVWLGDRSYALYLWHWPVIVLGGIALPGLPGGPVIAALGAGVIAYAAERWVERPLRVARFPDRVSRIAVCLMVVGVPLGCAAASDAIATQVWQPRVEALVADARKQTTITPVGYTLGCHFVGKGEPGVCRWHLDAPGAPIYLLGDSNAAHYTSGLVGASATLNRPLVVSTGSGCPLLGLTLVFDNDERISARCRHYVAATMAWIVQQPPGLVVLSMSDAYWLNDVIAVERDGVLVRDPAARVALMRGALHETVATLQRAGHTVLLLQTLPHFVAPYRWDPARCALWHLLADGCARRLPVGWAHQRSAAVRAAVADVAAATGASLGDLVDDVCPGGVCINFSAGGVIYRDATHLSNRASAGLRATLAREIVAATP
jgi:peptidoglycan/LPS O-acetylase OafA/YrhL